jgi:hypothetical protein
MLAEMDLVEMMNHSVMNHIIDGMHYLCLHRSPKVTLKLYLIERDSNDFSGFLLHPHTHRYAFDTVVLAGELDEIKFGEREGGEWDRHVYHTETRSFRPAATAGLVPHATRHRRGSHYFNSTSDIHTLRAVTVGEPVLLGLHQFQDMESRSNLFLPAGRPEAMKFSQSRRPSLDDMKWLRSRCLDLLN